MTRPHDSWADVYDLAYQEEYGPFINNLTELTLQVVESLLPVGSTIIDFGAGTGRLSIPLAHRGYRVTAVEPSGPMLERLRITDTDNSVDCVNSDIQSYRGDTGFDFAICVFTVVIYLLDRESLQAALGAAWRALSPGGGLLLDVPGPGVFCSHSFANERMARTVAIDPVNEEVCEYSEHIVVRAPNGDRVFEDHFKIRCWSAQDVLAGAEAAGFHLLADLSDTFAGSGSSYLLFQRAE